MDRARMSAWTVSIALSATALPVAGCAGTELLGGRARSATTASGGAVRVIRGWSSALRRGDVRAAAGYFHLPSEMVNGTASGGLALIVIHTLHDAVAANETLPCGAFLLSTARRGRFVDALFRLTGRPGPGGGTCRPGAGQMARTDFLIQDGRIVLWIRAPALLPPNLPVPALPPSSGQPAQV